MPDDRPPTLRDILLAILWGVVVSLCVVLLLLPLFVG